MKIYLVGGAVRDALLNLPVKDKDWVVVGGTEKMLLDKKFQQVGKDFPVFLHPKTHEEYALARKERKSGKGYTGFCTDSNANITLEEDLIRRDLTINAIAQDQNGKYIDPFHGIEDIKNRVIRHVSNSFSEDPLRVFRTARFAATLVHLGFCIAEETMVLMKIMVKNQELYYLTANRIWNETEKAFKTVSPHVYFQVLHLCKVLHFFFPKMYILYYKKSSLYLYRFNRWYHENFIFMGLAKISFYSKDIDVRFAYLCQFFLKKKIAINVSQDFYNKDAADFVKRLCQRFQIPSYIKEMAILNSGYRDFLNVIHTQSSKNIVLLFYKIDAWRKPERVKKLSFLNRFNYLNPFQSHVINFYSDCFLKQCFSITNEVSTKLIMKQGFTGIHIKHEIMRLRIQKLKLWRLKKNRI
ncbi:tRNA CCA-pyrophosphorylase [Buchnera aphidicola (Hyadaphis tataricae)]|uniref:CCA-adding enzyme n=1 Tax=Buchnera aphidicola (Hyadaphis tataricae) TaxID=1241859 RepID=A0A4D6XVI3_9GAMM|nr:tRNA CCA-pyrophosphorylase [Buchnera aphidicola]QCI21386.1 tRNA CCA-pyrophosphorylase [Buchnera aphidicola (Hyadaphis tataricae)]